MATYRYDKVTMQDFLETFVQDHGALGVQSRKNLEATRFNHLKHYPQEIFDHCKVKHGWYDLDYAWTTFVDSEPQVEDTREEREPVEEVDEEPEEDEVEEPDETVEIDDSISGILEDPDEVYAEDEIAVQMGW